MQKLVWQNANGDSIDLTSGNYGITQWEGFSNTSLNIQSQQVPFQDGAVFLDALLNQRELSVTLKMQDNGNLEERYRMRRELIHILNPKLGEGYLIYTNDFISKRIKCVAQVPLFETHNSDTRGTPKASLSWTACEPYWEDLEETVILLNDSLQEIQNNGDVSVGIKADFVTKKLMFSLVNTTQSKGIYAVVNKSGKYQVDTNRGEKKFIKQNLGYNILSSNCLSAIYEKNGLFLSMEGGFCAETNDYKTITVKSIQTSAQAGFNSICKKDGKYYASCDSAGIFVSTNLSEWKVAYASLASDIRMNLLENNMLIAYYDLAKYSVDGENWIDYALPEENRVFGIIYVSSKNKYYALTQKGIYEGKNLNVWILKYFDDYSSYFYNIVFDSVNNKFIVTVRIDGVYYIKTTSDFSTFTTVYTSTIHLNKIFKINEMFICSDDNGQLISGNGIENWTIISNVNGKSALIYIWNEEPYIYLLFANQMIIRSIDTQLWDYVNYNENPNFKYSVNNVYLLENGEIYGEASLFLQYIFFIINRENKITCLPRIYSNSGMVYYKGKYILFDGTEIKQSENGVDFVTIANISLQNNERLIFIFIINDMLVLHGISGQNHFAFTSSNGINWTRINNVSPINKRPIFFNGKWYSTYFDLSSVIDRPSLCTSINGFDFTSVRQLDGYAPSNMNVSEGKLLFTTGIGTTTHLYIVSSEEEIEVIELDFQKSDNGSVICKNGIYYIAGGYSGVVEKYSNTYIENNDIIKNYMNCICQNNNNDVFVFGNAFIGILDKDLTENVIESLSKDSNLTMGLEVGKNVFLSNIDGQIEIKYRQKYIGV